MNNFDFIASISQFSPFAPAALTAERLYAIDPAACAMNCRRAMELAVKWMYAVDKQLVLPHKKDLSVLLSTAEFVDLVDDKDLLRRLDFLRRLGNTAAHSGKKISRDQARLALENLLYFLDFIACCYAPDYQPTTLTPPSCPRNPGRSPSLPRRWTWRNCWRKTPPCGSN